MKVRPFLIFPALHLVAILSAWADDFAIAPDGNFLIDGEAYFGHTRASHRAKVLLQYARGFNATYYFKWDRRLDNPAFRTPDGPSRMAETFPYMALNPAATPPEAFAGMLDAKREIADVEKLFNPRGRGRPC